MVKGVTDGVSYPDRKMTQEEGTPGACLQSGGKYRIRKYSYTSHKTYDCEGLRGMIVHRPVTVAIAVSAAFFFYESGVFYECGKELNHAVLVTGLVE